MIAAVFALYLRLGLTSSQLGQGVSSEFAPVPFCSITRPRPTTSTYYSRHYSRPAMADLIIIRDYYYGGYMSPALLCHRYYDRLVSVTTAALPSQNINSEFALADRTASPSDQLWFALLNYCGETKNVASAG